MRPVETGIGLAPHRVAKDASLSGQPAIGWYLWDEDEERFAAAAIEVYSFAGERVTQIAAFASPELFRRFGLPAKLAA